MFLIPFLHNDEDVFCYLQPQQKRRLFLFMNYIISLAMTD